MKPSETSGQSRFPASPSSWERSERCHQSLYRASKCCFALLSIIMHPQGSICCVVSSPLLVPGEQPQRIFSKVLPSTAGGQSNQEADKECMTFPSRRDCWDLLEGIQLVNEHSRAESGLELVINYHKTSEGEYIGETHVCPRDGLRRRESAQQAPTEMEKGSWQPTSKQDDVDPRKMHNTRSKHHNWPPSQVSCTRNWLSWKPLALELVLRADPSPAQAAQAQPVNTLLLMSKTGAMK